MEARSAKLTTLRRSAPVCEAVRYTAAWRYFFLSFSPLHPAVACVSYARVAAPTACAHARGARYIPRFVSVKRARSWGLTIVV